MYLRSQPSRVPTPRCRGFTIAEMVVAIFLTALLAVLLAAAAATFARPAAEVDGRTRLALEASLAAEALARDLSGYLADNSGVPGTLTQYQFNNWVPSGQSRWFSIIREPPPYRSVSVTYQLQNYALVRTLSYPASECGGRQPRDRLQRLVYAIQTEPRTRIRHLRDDRDHPHLSRPVEPAPG